MNPNTWSNVIIDKMNANVKSQGATRPMPPEPPQDILDFDKLATFSQRDQKLLLIAYDVLISQESYLTDRAKRTLLAYGVLTLGEAIERRRKLALLTDEDV